MSKKAEILSFYEQELKQYFEDQFNSGIGWFKQEYKIGSGGFSLEEGTPMSSGGCHIKIIKYVLPMNVLKAFFKHVWYSHHCISDINVLKIAIKEITTYAICIHGYVDDGWDNEGNWVELYDEEGQLAGSIRIPCIDEPDEWETWQWLDRPLKGKDFNGNRVPSLLIPD